jgi:hypothetical protein
MDGCYVLSVGPAGWIARAISFAVPILALLVSLAALTVSGLLFYANITSGEQSADATIKQICLNWAEFVVAEHERGVSYPRIDRQAVVISVTTERWGFERSIVELCGGAELLGYARETDRPLQPILQGDDTSGE